MGLQSLVGAPRRGDAERGQVLPFVLIASVGLLSLASLAVDLGFWRFEQRAEQTAADSAAIAGAIQASYSTSLTSIVNAARTASSVNGFTHDGVKTMVTVNVPPVSGNYTSNPSAVEVIVQKTAPAFFSGIFGKRSQTVTARAVAIQSTANSNCIYALDPVGPSVTLNGATIYLPKCGIISNGELLFHQGSVDAAYIGFATPTANNTINQTAFPDAQPRQAIAVTDPCGSIPGCAYLTGNPPTSGSCQSQTTFGGGTVNVPAGRYCQQVLFNNTTKAVFSGIYDLEQGMTFNGTPSEIDGTGVTFYIKGGNWIVNGSPIVNLSAPSSGNTAGVLMYQPVANTTQFHINSGSSPGGGVYNGMLYFPGTTMIVDGKYVSWSLTVAKDILFNQGGTTSQTAGTNFGRAVLAE